MAAKLLKILKIPLFKVLTCAKSVHFTYTSYPNPLKISALTPSPSRLGGVWSAVRVCSPRHINLTMCEAVRMIIGYFLSGVFRAKSVYKCLYVYIKM